MGKRQRDALMKMMGSKGPGPSKPSQRKDQSTTVSSNANNAERNNGNNRVAEGSNRNAPNARSVPEGSAASIIAGDGTISDDMLAVTCATLKVLGEDDDLYRTGRFKNLRSLLFPLVKPAAGGHVARISEACSDERWKDAKVTIAAMRELGEKPKLGSVQRWIRDCDVVGTHVEAMTTMDAILRLCAPEQICPEPSSKEFVESSEVVDWLEPLSCVPLQAGPVPPEQLADPKEVAEKFTVLMREKAAFRRPPNRYDMVLWQALKDAMPMRPTNEVTVNKINIPNIPCCSYLDGVLSPAEATNIVNVAETIGMIPDHPITGKASVLANHFVWCDEDFIGKVFDRVKEHLPTVINGAPLVGINARMRCYRYRPGGCYRVHVDGAWPQSGVDEKGEYVYDVSQGAVSSKLTFLMYLNEGFSGGCTTFYTPAMEEGRMKATPVAPRVGGVLMFAHADTAGALLHEGSGVTEGTKYIIRTEVLYRCEGAKC